MTTARFDALCIGNAIMDVLGRVEDDFLVAEGLHKGEMRLVDATRSAELYGKLGSVVRMSGGSAGNTAAGVGSLGGRAAYIGKVAADDLGRAYAHDLKGMGLHFATAPLEGGAPTAVSVILVTPDGERTMNTHLGACLELRPQDVEADAEAVAAAAVTYLEGYLWDPPAAKDAFRRAAEIAHANDRKVAITLSDVVLRRSPPRRIPRSAALPHRRYRVRQRARAEGALRDRRHRRRGRGAARGQRDRGGDARRPRLARRHPGRDASRRRRPVSDIVDLTGAGDLYASGFLFGLARDLSLAECAAIGGLCAAEIIAQMGPRPQRPLADLARQAGFEV